MMLPALDQLLIFFEGFFGSEARAPGNALIHVHGGERDAAADADLVRGPSHLIRERSACFEKAGGAAADHRGIGSEPTAVDILGFEPAFKRDQVAGPHGALQFAPAPNGGDLAVQKLLRGMNVGIDKPGHGDQPGGVDRLPGMKMFRTLRRGPHPGDAVAHDGNGRVAEFRAVIVEGDDAGVMNQQVGLSYFSHASFLSIARPWYASWSNDISISREGSGRLVRPAAL